MKMNLKNIIFILGVLFLGSSCEKDVYKRQLYDLGTDEK